MKLFIIHTFAILALSSYVLGFNQSANAESIRKHYDDSYYARTNPHYGKVDSDGILSPGELRNPLINYNNSRFNKHDNYTENYSKDRHNCDYKKPYRDNDYRNNSYNNNGWLNYSEKRPTYSYGRPQGNRPIWKPNYR